MGIYVSASGCHRLKRKRKKEKTARSFSGDPCWITYREDEAVLEVGEFLVTLLTPKHAILLVNHFFVAVLARAGLIKTVFLAQKHNRSYAGVVVSLNKRPKKKSINIVTVTYSSRLTLMTFVLWMLTNANQNRNRIKLILRWHFWDYAVIYANSQK